MQLVRDVLAIGGALLGLAATGVPEGLLKSNHATGCCTMTLS
jgi:hypothetical protein